uniref:Uncharacterized protein n=2 Tax=Odontella aurita TaxID=265563 RepID=A0A7S4NE05_9STRA|mmetsp:Transcript_59887/g.177528  ORF Transcript_59887/g.177528 Transcript_59887/m.177528 type:complete len:626 (+) Transcript_59887:405-2282(+)
MAKYLESFPSLSSGCQGMYYPDSYGNSLYMGLKPLGQGNITIGMYWDDKCSVDSGLTLGDYVYIYYYNYYGDGSRGDDLTSYYEAMVDQWNEFMTIYKVCQPCPAYNLNKRDDSSGSGSGDNKDDRGRRMVEMERLLGSGDDEGDGEEEQWGYNCYDDAGYTNVNQCYKFETKTSMEEASLDDLIRADEQGTILSVRAHGRTFGTPVPWTAPSVGRTVATVLGITALLATAVGAAGFLLWRKRASGASRDRKMPAAFRETLDPNAGDGEEEGGGEQSNDWTPDKGDLIAMPPTTANTHSGEIRSVPIMLPLSDPSPPHTTTKSDPSREEHIADLLNRAYGPAASPELRLQKTLEAFKGREDKLVKKLEKYVAKREGGTSRTREGVEGKVGNGSSMFGSLVNFSLGGGKSFLEGLGRNFGDGVGGSGSTSDSESSDSNGGHENDHSDNNDERNSGDNGNKMINLDETHGKCSYDIGEEGEKQNSEDNEMVKIEGTETLPISKGGEVIIMVQQGNNNENAENKDDSETKEDKEENEAEDVENILPVSKGGEVDIVVQQGNNNVNAEKKEESESKEDKEENEAEDVENIWATGSTLEVYDAPIFSTPSDEKDENHGGKLFPQPLPPIV